MLPLQGARVPSLFGEVRPHKLHGVTRKKKKKACRFYRYQWAVKAIPLCSCVNPRHNAVRSEYLWLAAQSILTSTYSTQYLWNVTETLHREYQMTQWTKSSTTYRVVDIYFCAFLVPLPSSGNYMLWGVLLLSHWINVPALTTVGKLTIQTELFNCPIQLVSWSFLL